MSTQPVSEKFKTEEDDTSSLHDIPLTPPKPQQHHTKDIANIPNQSQAEPQEQLPSPEPLSGYFAKYGLLIGWLKDFAPQALKVEAVPFDDDFTFICRDIRGLLVSGEVEPGNVVLDPVLFPNCETQNLADEEKKKLVLGLLRMKRERTTSEGNSET